MFVKPYLLLDFDVRCIFQQVPQTHKRHLEHVQQRVVAEICRHATLLLSGDVQEVSGFKSFGGNTTCVYTQHRCRRESEQGQIAGVLTEEKQGHKVKRQCERKDRTEYSRHVWAG